MPGGFSRPKGGFAQPKGGFAQLRGGFASPGGGFVYPPDSWTPRQFSGLVDWHRSDLGVTLSGSNVSSWEDQSGQGHTLSQATDANRFSYVAGVIGGHPVLRPGVAGDDRFMSWTPWGGLSAATVFTVCRFRTKGAAYQSLLFFTGGSSFTGPYLGSATAAEKPVIFTNADNGIWSTALSDQTNYLIKWEWDDATEECATQVGAGTEQSSVSAAYTVGSVSTLGMDPAVTATQDIFSDIAELIIYNRRLSTAEEAQVRNYVTGRYGI